MVVMLKKYCRNMARQGPSSLGNLQIWGISGETDDFRLGLIQGVCALYALKEQM